MKKKTSKKDKGVLKGFTETMAEVTMALIKAYEKDDDLDDEDFLTLYSALLCAIVASHEEIMDKLKEFE